MRNPKQGSATSLQRAQRNRASGFAVPQQEVVEGAARGERFATRFGIVTCLVCDCATLLTQDCTTAGAFAQMPLPSEEQQGLGSLATPGPTPTKPS